MNPIVETRHPGDFLLSEATGARARDTMTLFKGQNLTAGTVVGKVTATGKLKAFAKSASDGTEIPAGVLYANVDATDNDQVCVIIARDAEVIESMLVWPATSFTGTDKAAATEKLKALGIIVR